MFQDWEERERSLWPDRPQKGDAVRLERWPRWTGVVTDTFYANGEGGMHVRWDVDGTSHGGWCHYGSVTIAERAKAPMPPEPDCNHTGETT